MATVVDSQLLSLGVRHQIDLDRYAAGVVQEITKLLDAAESDLMEQLRTKLSASPLTKRRTQTILNELRKINRDAHKAAADKLRPEMTEFALHEAEHVANMLATALPPTEMLATVGLSLAQPTAAQLAAIVDNTPITAGSGKLLLEEIFEGLAAGKEQHIRQAVRLGLSEGEGSDEIVRRLIGTRSAKYTDGTLAADRRGVTAMVRTIVNHTSNRAAQLTYAENSDVVDSWVFVATLDGRTTKICAGLSGRVFPIGTGPYPPRHVNCRSFSIPKVKTWRELGIDIDEAPTSTRASWRGPVPADISFSDWLKTEPLSTAQSILGKTGADLFFKGGLSLDRFTDSSGVILTLSQLKARNRAAFKRAGL